MFQWIQMWLDSIRDKNWEGSGVVIKKAYREELEGDGRVTVGVAPVFASSHVPERWVLVVALRDGTEIYREVTEQEWHAHEVGDVYVTPTGDSGLRGG